MRYTYQNNAIVDNTFGTSSTLNLVSADGQGNFCNKAAAVATTETTKQLTLIAVCKDSYVVQGAILTEWEDDRFSANHVMSANDVTS